MQFIGFSAYGVYYNTVIPMEVCKYRVRIYSFWARGVAFGSVLCALSDVRIFLVLKSVQMRNRLQPWSTSVTCESRLVMDKTDNRYLYIPHKVEIFHE